MQILLEPQWPKEENKSDPGQILIYNLTLPLLLCHKQDYFKPERQCQMNCQAGSTAIANFNVILLNLMLSI